MDFEFWDSFDEFELDAAACLWLNRTPKSPLRDDLFYAKYSSLIDAMRRLIDENDREKSPVYVGYGMGVAHREKITRGELEVLANRLGQRPAFLFIEMRLEILERLPPDVRNPMPSGDTNTWPWGKHETDLLRQLAAAAERFWRNYDPTDHTTAATNESVSRWLQDRGVAIRVADIMAQILRADGVPPGPRK